MRYLKSKNDRKTKTCKRITEIVICFLIGYFGYTGIETIYRGYSYSLMGMLGAVAFYIVGQINERRNVGLIWQGLIGSFLITIMELMTGSALLKYDVRMWDYSNLWGNYKGLICPLFSCAWFILSVLIVFIHDLLMYLFFNIPLKKYKLF